MCIRDRVGDARPQQRLIGGTAALPDEQVIPGHVTVAEVAGCDHRVELDAILQPRDLAGGRRAGARRGDKSGAQKHRKQGAHANL